MAISVMLLLVSDRAEPMFSYDSWALACMVKLIPLFYLQGKFPPGRVNSELTMVHVPLSMNVTHQLKMPPAKAIPQPLK